MLRDCILTPCDVDPDLLEARLLHCFRQHSSFTYPLPPLPPLPPGELSGDPFLEAAQVPFILGVRTHVSAPKSNTTCTTALKNDLETFGSALYQLRILVIHIQLFLEFIRLPATSVQSSLPAVRNLPRYLNNVTVSNGFL